jgi:hypothetical protein
LRPAQRQAALTGNEGVTDAVGSPKSFLCRRLSSDRFADDESRQSIQGEDLPKQPRIADFSREACRLGEVRPGQLAVVLGEATAGGQRPRDERRVAKFSCRCQSSLGVFEFDRRASK